MNSPPFDELISAYLDGELDAEQSAHVAQVLREDARLRRMYDQFKALRITLQKLPRAEPDEDLTARVVRRAERRMLAPQPVVATDDMPQDAGPADAATPIVTRHWRIGLIAITSVAALVLLALFVPAPWNRQVATAPRNVASAEHAVEEHCDATTAPAAGVVNDEPTSPSGRVDSQLSRRGATDEKPTMRERTPIGDGPAEAMEWHSSEKGQPAASAAETVVETPPNAAPKRDLAEHKDRGAVGRQLKKSLPKAKRPVIAPESEAPALGVGMTPSATPRLDTKKRPDEKESLGGVVPRAKRGKESEPVRLIPSRHDKMESFGLGMGGMGGGAALLPHDASKPKAADGPVADQDVQQTRKLDKSRKRANERHIDTLVSQLVSNGVLIVRASLRNGSARTASPEPDLLASTESLFGTRAGLRTRLASLSDITNSPDQVSAGRKMSNDTEKITPNQVLMVSGSKRQVQLVLGKLVERRDLRFQVVDPANQLRFLGQQTDTNKVDALFRSYFSRKAIGDDRSGSAGRLAKRARTVASPESRPAPTEATGESSSGDATRRAGAVPEGAPAPQLRPAVVYIVFHIDQTSGGDQMPAHATPRDDPK